MFRIKLGAVPIYRDWMNSRRPVNSDLGRRTVMAIYRVDVLIDDPKPVFDWIDEHVPANLVVRCMAYKTVKGWYVKAVFKRQTDAELFHLRWFPEAGDHTVAPFTSLGFSQ